MFHQNCYLSSAGIGVFNENVNFSTESDKKTTIYDLLFLIATCSSKNDNKLLSEIIIRTVTLL